MDYPLVLNLVIAKVPQDKGKNIIQSSSSIVTTYPKKLTIRK
jgi:hypothetical protein